MSRHLPPLVLVLLGAAAVALPARAAAPAPASAFASAAAAETRACADVAFTPASDDVAAAVRARGVTCAVARAFIRSSDGHPSARHRGYACTRTVVDIPEVLPHSRYDCRRGERRVTWKRY